jgi:hypothetical protein
VEARMSHSEAEKLFEERKKVATLSQIREIVFGTKDGLLVPLGVVSSMDEITSCHSALSIWYDSIPC